jgi:integrase
MRAGERRALQWGDIDWRGRRIQLQRAIVRSQLTTPKNHRRRRLDLSRRLRAELWLWLWRRRQRADWLAFGQLFPSGSSRRSRARRSTGRTYAKAFNRILDAAGLHRRGPHQMRHTFASLLLSDGVPILYVSRQLGHRDPSITLHAYAHWMPAASDVRAVDLLDDARPDAIQGATRHRSSRVENAVRPYERVVSPIRIEPPVRPMRFPQSDHSRLVAKCRAIHSEKTRRLSPAQRRSRYFS